MSAGLISKMARYLQSMGKTKKILNQLYMHG